jgi:hypothetical protein
MTRETVTRLILGASMTIAMSCGLSSPGQPSASGDSKLPPARGYHFMVGLGNDPGVLLFSGSTAPPRRGGYDLGDVWLWRNGRGWTQKTGLGQKYGCPVLVPATRPCRSSDFASYDPKTGQMVVLATDAGQAAPLAENWTYDVRNDSWQQRALDKRPEFLNGTVAALDTESRRLIAFNGETWAYDPAANSWQQMHPKTSPMFGAFAAFVYDERDDRLILLGGEDRGSLSDVWAYDFNHDSWTASDTGSGPSARLYTAVAYDPRSGRVVLFAGMTPSDDRALNDTWSYDPATNRWTELRPHTSPPARGRHAMAFDSESGHIVMFSGGEDPLSYQRDTWIFDPGTNNWARG